MIAKGDNLNENLANINTLRVVIWPRKAYIGKVCFKFIFKFYDF